MTLKKQSLHNCNLYLILDTSVLPYDKLYPVALEAIAAGVDVVQLRDKYHDARSMVEFSRQILAATKFKVPYIINDRVDIAMSVGAHGVHLGQQDLSVSDARRCAGSKMLIGLSCQTLDHVRQAHAEGVDYIGFGSIFKTRTKPKRSPMELNRLKEVLTVESCPLFPIGGIDYNNIEDLTVLGVTRVAVCRSILEAADVFKSVQILKQCLGCISSSVI